jgi:hypothetical protein
MTLLTEATDVFAAAERSGRCLVAFVAKRQPLASGVFGSDQALQLKDLLRTLQAEGWLMSVRAMFELNAPAESYVFETGFAHDADMVGAFEAPSLSAALAGTVGSEKVGSPVCDQWLRARGNSPPCRAVVKTILGFLTLGMDDVGPPRRKRSAAYDEECDVASGRCRAGITLLDARPIGRAAGIMRGWRSPPAP